MTTNPIYAHDVFVLWRYLRHEGFSVDECIDISQERFKVADCHFQEWKRFVYDSIASYLDEWTAILPTEWADDRIVRLVWGEKLSQWQLRKLVEIVEETRAIQR